MASINKVILIGHVGRDPETRHMSSGDPVVSFSLATSESWKDKNTGERKDKTEWHNVVIFNDGLAKVAEKYLRKGSKIYVEGQLQTRKFTDKNGVERQTTEIILQRYRGELTLLDGKDDNNEIRPKQERATDTRTTPSHSSQRASKYDIDDEIPF